MAELTITYKMIREAMRGPYPMTIADRDEAQAVVDAVNQGIDSHLEACYVANRGDVYEPEDTFVGKGKSRKLLARKLRCVVSVESFPTLLRRLSEQADEGNEAAENLLLSILGTLGEPLSQAGEAIYEIIAPQDEPDGTSATM